MTLIIICTAASLDATNALLRGAPFGATGDNVSVPIVVETATTEEAQLYGCNWEAFDPDHFTTLKQMAKQTEGLYVYDGKKEQSFDKLLKRLRIKRKESASDLQL